MPDTVLVFSGFNQRAVVALCRTLAACRVEWMIIACSSHDTIFQTRYAGHIAAVRGRVALDLHDLRSSIEKARANTSRKFLIAPTSEALNLFLLDHRAAFEEAGDVISLVPGSLYRTISDKSPFIALCRAHGIDVPDEVTAVTMPELPVVAKPFTEMTESGRRLYPILIYTRQEWDRFTALPERRHYFLQRYISGPSYYLQWYFHASGAVDRFSMRNLVQQPAGKSIVAAEPSRIHEDSRYRVFESLFHEARFRGLVMVEIMLEGEGYRVIEANPRMWGPSQLMVDAGSNLLVSMLNDYLGTAFPLDICDVHAAPRYFWWAGFWAPQLRSQAMKWHCPRAEFWALYPEMIAAEVYCRPDTRQIFVSEADALPVPVRATHMFEETHELASRIGTT
jgi:hypothetical protein